MLLKVHVGEIVLEKETSVTYIYIHFIYTLYIYIHTHQMFARKYPEKKRQLRSTLDNLCMD